MGCKRLLSAWNLLSRLNYCWRQKRIRMLMKCVYWLLVVGLLLNLEHLTGLTLDGLLVSRECLVILHDLKMKNRWWLWARMSY